jgi:hypothetical protein
MILVKLEEFPYISSRSVITIERFQERDEYLLDKFTFSKLKRVADYPPSVRLY